MTIAHCKPIYEDDHGEIHKMDAVELVGQIPNESVDLIIFDPAYESLEKHRKIGSTTRLKHSESSSNDWFEIFPNSGYFPLFGHLYRIMKPGTHLYMFCDEETRNLVTTGFSPQTMEYIKKSTGLDKDESMTCPEEAPLVRPGFKYWKSLVFDKVVPGMGYHYRAQHEYIIFAEKVRAKGKHRQLNEKKTGDILSVKRLAGKGFYPTMKPLPLVWKLISQSTDKEQIVFDPFVGGGTTAVAAAMCGRRFVVGDISDKAIEYTIQKLKELKKK